MKQYLLSIYGPDSPAPPEVMARMDQIMADVNALVEETKTAGAWVFNAGLLPPGSATVVRLGRGEVLMTDGPYVEGKEHVGGFLIVKAPDLDAALAWGGKLARALSDGIESLPIEVRPFRDEAEDS